MAAPFAALAILAHLARVKTSWRPPRPLCGRVAVCRGAAVGQPPASPRLSAALPGPGAASPCPGAPPERPSLKGGYKP